MKRIIKFVSFLFIMLCAVLAEEAKPVFEVRSNFQNGCILKAGENITVDFSIMYPEQYNFCGSSVFAYVPSLPGDFCAVTGKNASAPSDPKWASVRLENMVWIPSSERTKREHRRSFSTKDWPKGDYRVTFSLFYQIPKRTDPKTDKYQHTTIYFTLE